MNRSCLPAGIVMRAVAALALLPSSVHADGQVFKVQVVSGIWLTQSASGRWDFIAGDTLTLANGTVLRRDGDGWQASPPPSGPASETVAPIDFSVDWRSYIGKRIQVRGRVFGADVDHGLVELPGSSATIAFQGLPHSVIKTLIQGCGDIETGARCVFDITASVGADVGGTALLINPALAAAAPSPQKDRIVPKAR